MLDYLKKFNDLPAGLRQKVSNQTAVAKIEALEGEYQLALAALIMRVMVKEIALKDLVSYLSKQGLAKAAAEQLARELREKIFFSAIDYLSVVEPRPAVIRPGGGQTAAPAVFSKSPAGAADAPSEDVSVKVDRAADRQSDRTKPDSESLVRGANFFFSADDEAEVRELTRRIDLARKTELPEAAIEEKLKTIIDRAQINFGSADLAERFGRILKTYLRGTRDKVEAKMTLTKPFSNGGLSFDDDSAQQIMDMTDKILSSRPDEVVKPLSKIKIPAPIRDAPYDFSELVKEKKASGPGVAAKSAQPGPTGYELAPLPPAVKPPVARTISLAAGKEVARPTGEDKIKMTTKERATDMGWLPPAKIRSLAGSLGAGRKAKVEDVKYVPKVMSPSDEIRYLDLIGFRRLDKDPVAAAEKVKSKIDLLAEESYGKKLEGIKFWRSSPVNKLYLEIGHRGISENKTVDAIIEERKTGGEDCLTTEEFRAIMDLNKSLRF
jgi:hypothetical protein